MIKIKDFESVKQAKAYAEYQLRFYTKMMEEKIANQRLNQAASRNSRLIQF